jgi:acetyl-CoA synthetase/medium-chain acyl-CoA synthetase
MSKQQAEPSPLVAPAAYNFATDAFDYWSRVRPDAPALWWVQHASGAERRFSFRELSELSSRAANLFVGCGIRPGDRVLLMLPRLPEWWIAMLGLIRMGGIPVPATLLLTARDVAYRTETAQVHAIITSKEGLAKVEGFDGIRIFVSAGVGGLAESGPAGWIDFQAGLKKVSSNFGPVASSSDAPSLIFFTSATAGDPKMVLHTHASYGLGHRLTGKWWLDLGPDDVHWNVSDLGWAKAAWSSFFGPWIMGACVFALDIAGKFDASATLDVLANHPITTWCAPPTALRHIVRQSLGHWRFPSLRHCVTAGEPLNPEVFNLWQGATGLALHEAYGQTETVVLVGNYRSLGHELRPGSMGKATPGMEVALLDEELQQVPPGSEGEVALRVKPHRPVGLFQEYWRNPEDTARQFRGDWYLTGDRAVCDPEGYFWFIGRKDDVIKSSGYRIGPFEVESALLEHPAVLDAAVIGKPDALRGQIVKACIILRPGQEGTEALKAELQSHCKRLIAAYKYPREIEFMPDLPRTTSGKTRRVQLRQAAAQPRPAAH